MNSLTIHFLNVGHGDCTIIEFPNRLTVIDINRCKTFATDTEAELRKKYGARFAPSPFLLPAGSSLAGILAAGRQLRQVQAAIDGDKERLTDPVEYIKRNFPGRSIFRYIQTHPDMDHMAGLYHLTAVERVQIVNFWDTHHAIEKEEFATDADVKDWQMYQHIRSGKYGATVLTLDWTASNHYYADDGISLWAPFDQDKANDPDADPNSLSYVLHIQFGKCSIVLGGDLPEERWAELYAKIRGQFPKINLLKPSHHGRKSGYHRDSVKAMSPDVTVVSVGELKAKDDATASYERFSNVGCFSTIDHGDIVATCWADGDVWLDSRSKRIHPVRVESHALYNALLGVRRQ